MNKFETKDTYGGNWILKEKNHYISYGSGETVLIKDNKHYKLIGDFRQEYEATDPFYHLDFYYSRAGFRNWLYLVWRLARGGFRALRDVEVGS